MTDRNDELAGLPASVIERDAYADGVKAGQAPRTEAGRALERRIDNDEMFLDPGATYVVAIEVEAVHTALDELRRAVEGLPGVDLDDWRAAVLAEINKAASR